MNDTSEEAGKGMSDNDEVAAALDEIRDRNEQSIAKLKLSGPFLLGRSAYGDVRRLLAALDEVQDLHLPSLTVILAVVIGDMYEPLEHIGRKCQGKTALGDVPRILGRIEFVLHHYRVYGQAV